MKNILFKTFFNLLFVLCATFLSNAQTTEFTYQGKLNDAGASANANYDFEFRLYAIETGGAPLASIQRAAVAVASGIFTVKLDFGANNFDGSPRFLEIAVKPAGGGSYTVLAPRQSLTSAPYSIRSLQATNAGNAERFGGFLPNQFVQTNDTRLSDARNPLPNSPNYINNTTVQQAASNFNISGTGAANIFSAATQFNLGGERILSAPLYGNLFVGLQAGQAGGGLNNSLFGDRAGLNNEGSNNSFFGGVAGTSNSSGEGNSFFGKNAGFGNTTGSFNSFFGVSTGSFNTTGSRNTALGFDADFSSNNLSYATAIGSGTLASQSNSIFLGRQNGEDTVRVPGAMTIGGTFNLNASAIITGSLVVQTLGAAGSTSVCLNSANRFAPCSSSLRYKSNVETFTGGLDIVRQLRPVTFNWTDGGMKDVGFGAEEVFRIAPVLTTTNAKGEIEGVKYPQLSTVLVNSVNEQQTQIETQNARIDQLQEQVRRQQALIENLRRLVCQTSAPSEVCTGQP